MKANTNAWVYTPDTPLLQLLCSLILIPSPCWRHHRDTARSPSPSPALLYGGVHCWEETIQTKRWGALRTHERVCNTRLSCYPPSLIQTMRPDSVSIPPQTGCGAIRSGIPSERLAKGKRHPSALRTIINWAPFHPYFTPRPSFPHLRTCAHMAIVRTSSRDLSSSSSSSSSPRCRALALLPI